jgi:hypothetical protein
VLWNVIALRGLGGGIKRRFVLLRLDGFQVKVEIVNVCLKSHQVLWVPLGFPFNLYLVSTYTCTASPS